MKKSILILIAALVSLTCMAQTPYPFRTEECGDLKVNYGFRLAGIRTVSVTSTLTVNDCVITLSVDTTTQTLPTAASVAGKILMIKADDAGSNTADGAGDETIDGSATKVITTKKTLIIISNGTNWKILSYN